MNKKRRTKVVRSIKKREHLVPVKNELELMIKSIKINNPGLKQEIEDVFRTVDRKFFVKNSPYIDDAIHIAFGQTISQPTTVARMLNRLELSPGLDVLEVGTNTGYHAALTSDLVFPGTVTTVEIFPKLADDAIKNINRFIKSLKNKKLKEKFEIQFIIGDALDKRNHIWLKKYDRIFFTAGVSKEHIKRVKEMALTLLNDDGLILFPSRDFYDYGGLELWKFKAGRLTLISKEQGYSFVPILSQKDLTDIYRVVNK
jgi:protein-L-isoaspartate(D-aspartate) O-methyltransferase